MLFIVLFKRCGVCWGSGRGVFGNGLFSVNFRVRVLRWLVVFNWVSRWLCF